MRRNEYDLTVDIKRKFTSVVPTFVQYDSASLRFYILDDNIPYDLSGFKQGVVYHKKPDGTVSEGVAELKVDNNGRDYIEYKYLGSEMSVIGDVETSLSIHSSDKRVTIQSFTVRIVKDLSEYYANPSTPEYGRLQELVAKVESALDKTEEITKIADKAAKDSKETKEEVENLKDELVVIKKDTSNAKDSAIEASQSASEAAERAETSTEKADESSERARESANYAKSQGDYAKEQGDFANLKGEYAKSKGEMSETQGQYAEEQGDYAKAQGDYAKSQTESLENLAESADVHVEKIRESITEAEASIESVNSATESALSSSEAAEESSNLASSMAELASKEGKYAKEQGDYAKLKGDYADEKAILADEAAASASAEASNLNALKGDVVDATQSANTAAKNANEKAQMADVATDRANERIESMDSLIPQVEGLENKGLYNSEYKYTKNNIVEYNGSSYQALKDNVNTPVSDTDTWSLVAQRGVDGEGAVSSVNGISPEEDGDVTLTAEDIGAVVSVNGQTGEVEINLDGSLIYTQPEEPIDAEEWSLWLDTSDATYQGTVFEELEDEINRVDELFKNVAFGMADIISDIQEVEGEVESHVEDEVIHITESERERWDGVDKQLNVGDSLEAGRDASAKGSSSVALGERATANSLFSIAIGSRATAVDSSLVIGNNSSTEGNFSVILGGSSTIEESFSVALGSRSTAENYNSGVLGGDKYNQANKWLVPGSLTVNGTKNFEMPHPHPDKKDTHVIRHAAVESPTAGDTLYRYEVEATEDNETVTLQLPDYFEHLNKDVDVWVNGIKHFGRAYADVEGDILKVTCELKGKYRCLVVGTRNDDHDSVQDWHIKGVEREVGESWTGEPYNFTDDYIITDDDEIFEEVI